MADYFWAQIEIGGSIPRRLVPKLLQLIGEADRDYEGTPFTATSADSLLEQLDPETGLLRLMDQQPRYGEFEELETFSRKQKIAYDRQSAGKYEFDPCLVQFRPGMKKPQWRLLANDDAPVVKLEGVQEAYDLLKAGRNSKALAKLNEIIGPEVSELEPLTIV